MLAMAVIQRIRTFGFGLALLLILSCGSDSAGVSSSYKTAVEQYTLDLQQDNEVVTRQSLGDDSPAAVQAYLSGFSQNVRVFMERLSKLAPPNSARQPQMKLLDVSGSLVSLADRLNSGDQSGLTLDNTFGAQLQLFHQFADTCQTLASSVRADVACTQLLGPNDESSPTGRTTSTHPPTAAS